jgi:phospholipid transport system transporter-binding protein
MAAIATLNPQSDGSLKIVGDLTAATVPLLYKSGQQFVESAEKLLQMDLSDVGQADSAGLALLIDWLATAQQFGKGLRYVNLPPTLQSLAELSEVTGLLAAAS